MFRKRETIEKMILSYLARNPDAADTVEGITKFWMQQENAKITFTKVSDTLVKLLKKGFIQTFQSADGTLYYKLKKRPSREKTNSSIAISRRMLAEGGKMPKITRAKKSVATSDTMEVSVNRFAFDATKTLAALKIIAKKRDPELRKKILAASFKQTKKGKQTKPNAPDKKVLFFNSSLPLNVTPDAQKIVSKIVSQLKASKNGVIKFPENMNEGGDVVCIDNPNKPAEKRVIGKLRKLYIEKTDPMRMDISQMGLFVQTLKSDPEQLEFIIKVPSLPGILRSPKFNDQGGLTHQLRISHGYEKKGE